jgi:hypothetical protein
MGTTTPKFEPGVDLDTFSASIDSHIGTPVGFADKVRHLADLKATIKAAGERRAAVYDALKTAHGGGGAQVVPIGAGGVENKVLRLATTRGGVSRTVPSEVLKKADKAAWEAARRPRAKLSLTAPATYRPGGGAVKLPPLPRADMGLAQLVALYQSPLFDVIATCDNEVEDVRDDLEKIAANAGWDGGIENGALLTTDGWQLKLRELAYDADKLKANDPALYDRLARTVERKGSTRLVVMGYDHALAAGYLDEFDEIDGD